MCAHALVLCLKGLDLSKMDPYVGAHELGHPMLDNLNPSVDWAEFRPCFRPVAFSHP